MLFDLHPKETAESLFGRDDKLSTMLTHLSNNRWLSLLGPRMVGKTSLAKAALYKLRKDKYTTLYISLWGTSSIRGFLDSILLAISNTKTLSQQIRKKLEKIEELVVGPVGISVAKGSKPVSLTGQILALLGANSKKLIIVLDEVQELSPVSAHLHKILANLFSTYPNITFCFTGSQSGLIRSLQSPGPDSPLYGRSPAELPIHPFDKWTAKSFLNAGFEEHDLSISEEEIDEVVDRCGGIPGWLTFYGNGRVISGQDHREAMKHCEREAFKTSQQTLDHHFRGRKKKEHLVALQAIALRSSWTQIRRAIEINTGRRINDGTLKNIIDSLMASYIIEKNGEVYQIIDPVLRRYLLSGKAK